MIYVVLVVVVVVVVVVAVAAIKNTPFVVQPPTNPRLTGKSPMESNVRSATSFQLRLQLPQRLTNQSNCRDIILTRTHSPIAVEPPPKNSFSVFGLKLIRDRDLTQLIHDQRQ